VLFLGSQMAQAQLLVTNGDFETGDLTGWTNSGNVTVISSAVINGIFSLDYSGGDTPTNGVISQTISVTPGVPYQLRFSYGYLGVNKNHQMDIQVDGAGGVGSLVDDSVNMTTLFSAPQTYNQTFTPDAATVTIRFSDVAANDTFGSDMILDEVAVFQAMVINFPVVVPMMSQYTLIALGFLMVLMSIFFIRKRKALK
jgi:hypothetical protein